jgi:hypothetical protein
MSSTPDPQTAPDPVQKLFDLVENAFASLNPGVMATIQGIPAVRVSNQWWHQYQVHDDDPIPAEVTVFHAFAPDDDDRAAALIRHIEDQIANEVVSISPSVLVQVIVYVAKAEDLVEDGSNYYNVELHYMRELPPAEAVPASTDSGEEAPHDPDTPL